LKKHQFQDFFVLLTGWYNTCERILLSFNKLLIWTSGLLTFYNFLLMLFRAVFFCLESREWAFKSVDFEFYNGVYSWCSRIDVFFSR